MTIFLCEMVDTRRKNAIYTRNRRFIRVCCLLVVLFSVTNRSTRVTRVLMMLLNKTNYSNQIQGEFVVQRNRFAIFHCRVPTLQTTSSNTTNVQPKKEIQHRLHWSPVAYRCTRVLIGFSLSREDTRYTSIRYLPSIARVVYSASPLLASPLLCSAHLDSSSSGTSWLG